MGLLAVLLFGSLVLTVWGLYATGVVAPRLKVLRMDPVSSGEVETELSDGRIYRGTKRGFAWRSFPDGSEAPVSMQLRLTEEFEKREAAKRWAEELGAK